jgi:hypothetical protein
MAVDLYKQMQDARRAHRHAAHLYAHTKNTPENRPAYEEAVEKLEQAAMMFTMAAMAYGRTQSDAPPATSKRLEWERETNPDPDIPRKPR